MTLVLLGRTLRRRWGVRWKRCAGSTFAVLYIYYDGLWILYCRKVWRHRFYDPILPVRPDFIGDPWHGAELRLTPRQGGRRRKNRVKDSS